MLAVNSLTVGGKLVEDIRVVKTNNGKDIGFMRLSIVEKDEEGKEGKETVVEVKLLGRQIDAYSKKFKRGAYVMVEGKLSSFVDRGGKVWISVLSRHAHFVGPPSRIIEVMRKEDEIKTEEPEDQSFLQKQ